MVYMDVKCRKSPKLGKKKKNTSTKFSYSDIFFPWLSLNMVSHLITQTSFLRAFHYPLIHCGSWLPCCCFFKFLAFREFLGLLTRFGTGELPNFSVQPFLPILLYKMSSVPLTPQFSLILNFFPNPPSRWQMRVCNKGFRNLSAHSLKC